MTLLKSLKYHVYTNGNRIFISVWVTQLFLNISRILLRPKALRFWDKYTISHRLESSTLFYIYQFSTIYKTKLSINSIYELKWISCRRWKFFTFYSEIQTRRRRRSVDIEKWLPRHPLIYNYNNKMPHF